MQLVFSSLEPWKVASDRHPEIRCGSARAPLGHIIYDASDCNVYQDPGRDCHFFFSTAVPWKNLPSCFWPPSGVFSSSFITSHPTSHPRSHQHLARFSVPITTSFLLQFLQCLGSIMPSMQHLPARPTVPTQSRITNPSCLELSQAPQSAPPPM